MGGEDQMMNTGYFVAEHSTAVTPPLFKYLIIKV
jgi:hypothetical protein